MSSNKYTKEYKVVDGNLTHVVVMLHATQDDKNILKARVITRRSDDKDPNVHLDTCSTIYTLKKAMLERTTNLEALRTYMTPNQDDCDNICYNLAVPSNSMDVVKAFNRPIWDAQDRALTNAFYSNFRSPLTNRLTDLKEVESVYIKPSQFQVADIG